jgi:histone H2A
MEFDLSPVFHLFFLMQLSLTQSDISHIGSMRVEGIVHPTTAEIDLKEDIGKVLRPGKGAME